MKRVLRALKLITKNNKLGLGNITIFESGRVYLQRR